LRGNNLNKSPEALSLDGHMSGGGLLDAVQSPINLSSLSVKRAKIRGSSAGSRQDRSAMLTTISATQIKHRLDNLFQLKQTAATPPSGNPPGARGRAAPPAPHRRRRRRQTPPSRPRRR